MMHHDEGSIEETSSELSMRSKKKEKTKVLPEHYVSQKAIDDLCRRAKTVHPTVNDFHGELKSLQQYTRSLYSRLSSLETQVRRASLRFRAGASVLAFFSIITSPAGRLARSKGW